MRINTTLWTALLLLSAFAGGVAKADTLDPFLVNGSLTETLVQASGSPDFDTENSGASYLGLGFTPTLPVTGGAFSVLDNGALGISAHGPDEFVGALMYVNISFSGSSTQLSTARMHVAVPSSNFGGGPLDYLHFATGISATEVDLTHHQILQELNDSIQAGSPLSPQNPMPIAGPYDLSVSFPVNSTLHQYQFAFSVGAITEGNAAVDAIHTALISFDLGNNDGPE